MTGGISSGGEGNPVPAGWRVMRFPGGAVTLETPDGLQVTRSLPHDWVNWHEFLTELVEEMKEKERKS